MSDVAIRVDGLGKRYRIAPEKREAGSLAGRVKQTTAAPFDWLIRQVRGPSEEEILWALKDVSFEVKRGEVLGVIGPNGAGKSTLLKVLSRITDPTEGYAEINGRVGSLLEVGTGMHPELSGRENIYLNGCILGMRRAEINDKFDEIVEFSGIERFIETPVKRYSSGMKVRLGFSIAAHLEPEILLIDEVLAVGDAEFQKKCLGKMDDVAESGRTVLFVSHNMGSIDKLCDRCILLSTGELSADGPTESVISDYLSDGTESTAVVRWEHDRSDSGELIPRELRVKNDKAEPSVRLDVRKPFQLQFVYELTEKLPYARIGFLIYDERGTLLFDTYDSDIEEYRGPRQPGSYVSTCVVPGHLLKPGGYTVTVNAGIPGMRSLVREDHIVKIGIEDVGTVGSDFRGTRRGVIRPALDWETTKTADMGVLRSSDNVVVAD